MIIPVSDVCLSPSPPGPLHAQFINDGETGEELDRVLKENRRLRKANQQLQRNVASLRLTGSIGGGTPEVRGSKGGGKGSKGGGKREWQSSLVDDELYRKPEQPPRGKRKGQR